MYLKLRGDTVVPQLSSLKLSSLDVYSRIEAPTVPLPLIVHLLHPLDCGATHSWWQHYLVKLNTVGQNQIGRASCRERVCLAV